MADSRRNTFAHTLLKSCACSSSLNPEDATGDVGFNIAGGGTRGICDGVSGFEVVKDENSDIWLFVSGVKRSRPKTNEITPSENSIELVETFRNHPLIKIKDHH